MGVGNFMRRQRFSAMLVAIMLGLPSVRAEEDERLPVPHPRDQRCNVVSRGLTSTLRELDVACLGKNIPCTWSDDKITNSDGFEWWVSRHFALKTDYGRKDAAKIRDALEKLEMAYYQWAYCYFGREPRGSDFRRIVLVFARSRKTANRSTHDHGLQRGPYGSGEKLFYNHVAHAYGGSQYLVMHETFHAINSIMWYEVNGLGGFFGEGSAQDAVSIRRDHRNKQQTNFVVDKPWGTTSKGSVRSWRSKRHPKIENFSTHWRGYGPGAGMLHFLMDEPLRYQFYKIWLDEMEKTPGRARKAQANVISLSLYGSWQAIEAEFKEWLEDSKRETRFEGGKWEARGSMFWRRKGDGRVCITLTPGSPVCRRGVLMDYPSPEPSPLVGLVERDVDEPSLGCLIGYDRDEEGAIINKAVGLGLACDEKRPTCKILLLDASRLRIAIGDADPIEKNLPGNMVSALKESSNPKIGMHVTIASKSLDVRLRCDVKGSVESFSSSASLTKAQREQILDGTISLEAQGGGAGIAPYLDDGSQPVSAYMVEGPINRWLNPGDQQLGWLTKACWRLGDQVPKRLLSLRNEMQVAASGSQADQLRALAQFEEVVPQFAKAIKATNSEKAPQAVADLSGCWFRLEWGEDHDEKTVPLVIDLKNRSAHRVTGRIKLSTNPEKMVKKFKNEISVELDPFEELRVVRKLERERVYEPYSDQFKIQGTADLKWCGQELAMADEIGDRLWPGTCSRPHKELVVNGNEAIAVVSLFGYDRDFTIKGKLHFKAVPVDAVEVAEFTEEFDMTRWEVLKIKKKFIMKDPSKPLTVEVTSNIKVRDEPLRFREESVWRGRAN